MDYFYEFCGVRFRVEAERPMWTEPQADQFLISPAVPDVRIHTVCCPELPEAEGVRLGSRGEQTVWRSGDTITRYAQDPFRKQPHLRTSYALSAVQDVQCAALEPDWRWATRSQFFWPGISLPQLLLHFRTLVFHASYAGCGGGAVLFSAPSRTGKSTQAALWERHRGAKVLNGDKAAVRLDGPAIVHGLPVCGTSGICKNVSLPLRCVVLLSQAPENSIRRLRLTEALPLLSRNLFADTLVSEEWQLALSLLLDLLAEVPVYALACTPDVRAVETLEAAMARDGLISDHGRRL